MCGVGDVMKPHCVTAHHCAIVIVVIIVRASVHAMELTAIVVGFTPLERIRIIHIIMICASIRANVPAMTTGAHSSAWFPITPPITPSSFVFVLYPLVHLSNSIQSDHVSLRGISFEPRLGV